MKAAVNDESVVTIEPCNFLTILCLSYETCSTAIMGKSVAMFSKRMQVSGLSWDLQVQLVINAGIHIVQSGKPKTCIEPCAL